MVLNIPTSEQTFPQVSKQVSGASKGSEGVSRASAMKQSMVEQTTQQAEPVEQTSGPF